NFTFIENPEGATFLGHSKTVIWILLPDSSKRIHFSSLHVNIANINDKISGIVLWRLDHQTSLARTSLDQQQGEYVGNESLRNCLSYSIDLCNMTTTTHSHPDIDSRKLLLKQMKIFLFDEKQYFACTSESSEERLFSESTANHEPSYSE
ncbi:hypothetical protein ALC53_06404, partial [Atta colombica]